VLVPWSTGETQKWLDFGDFRPVPVKNGKNELSGTQSPLKVSFAGVPIPTKTKKSSSFACLAAVVDCISGGLCWSLVSRIRCD
jgi:hypothetical protein